MEPAALQTLLKDLIATWENEVTEFKRAGNDYPTDDIGKYFAALANEANLRGAERGWLVFGVDNKSRAVVGTDYRTKSEQLQNTKMQVADGTQPKITFRDIHELHTPSGRVVLFEIPAAPRGIPIAWKGHYYARAGESLISLGLDKQDEIRKQASGNDWTAHLVPGATQAHLDPAAVQAARESFAKKHANRFSVDEVMGWNLPAFLDRTRLTLDGQITRAALLLLGTPESSHLLQHPAQITWKLQGPETAYEHFSPPFLLNTSALYKKIRNPQLRLLPTDAMVAVELPKYSQKVVLEALHNCIAHQDYGRDARIVVTETPDRLCLENEGGFFDGKPEDYITGHKTPRRYRNPLLTKAMTELNMIDTMGYGIHEMHRGQALRFFPMPDYDLSAPEVVRITIHGSIADPAYSRMLMENTSLPLADILALDRVQKRLPLDNDTIKHLRRVGLVEGRKSNLHVSASIASATASKANDIRTRAQDDTFYAKLITDYLAQYGAASREELDELLWNKLSGALDKAQKQNKIGNLLTSLRRAGRIQNVGSRKVSAWQLTD